MKIRRFMGVKTSKRTRATKLRDKIQSSPKDSLCSIRRKRKGKL
jgi:hypothetical protein